jgi:2-amino-4-hydroxy-6-hydroxymethyldihydropteridine diphosphokinase
MARPTPVVIALGSNVGDRRRHLRTAVRQLSQSLRVVRVSGVWESDPVDCPPGSGPFLNMALSGVTGCAPGELLEALHAIEERAGRRRRRPNEPRVIDLDLIFFGAWLSSGGSPAIPHPRYDARAFVLAPFAELGLDWTVAGRRVRGLRGTGGVRRVGTLY